MNVSPREYLEFKSRQHVGQLYKDWLFILEDFRDQGKIDDDDFAFYRKRVLDMGNTKIREFKEELDKFEIN